MTLDEKIAAARKMRERGAKLREIGERFGVSIHTAHRWTTPGEIERSRERSRDWKFRNRNRVKLYGKMRYFDRLIECPRCGSLMHPKSKLCAGCHQDRALGRRKTIARMWQQGALLKEISHELGTSIGTVSSTITRMRKDGWDLPHRRRGRR